MHQLASCHAGTAASEQEKTLQQALLKHILQEAAPEAPPQLLVDAAAVLISAAMPSHSPASTSQSGWMQEGDDDLQQQLAELARGINREPPLQSPQYPFVVFPEGPYAQVSCVSCGTVDQACDRLTVMRLQE